MCGYLCLSGVSVARSIVERGLAWQSLRAAVALRSFPYNDLSSGLDIFHIAPVDFLPTGSRSPEKERGTTRRRGVTNFSRAHLLQRLAKGSDGFAVNLLEILSVNHHCFHTMLFLRFSF